MHTTWADKKHEIARPVYGRKHIVDNGNERRNRRRMNNHILWQYTVDDHSIPLTITLSLTTNQAWTDEQKLCCTTSLAALYWRTYWNVITTQVISNDKTALWLSIEPWFDLVRPILTTIVQFLATSAICVMTQKISKKLQNKWTDLWPTECRRHYKLRIEAICLCCRGGAQLSNATLNAIWIICYENLRSRGRS